MGATHPISSMPRGSAPIIPCGSAFRICLFHRQIHGSRRRARARCIVLQYSCPHKKVSFGWPFCVDEGTPGAQHPISYMPLISRKKYCTKIAKITQFWCNIGFASCRMPEIRTEGRQCQLRQHRNQSVREMVSVMVETYRRLLEWQIRELRKLEPGLPELQAAQFSRHVHLCTSAP